MQPLERDPAGGRFERIASHGFGCGHNTYAHSMAWFQDHLYVGTTVHTLCLVRAAPPKTPAALDPWPVPVPGDLFSLDLRAQIWRYSPATARWRRSARSVTSGPRRPCSRASQSVHRHTN